MDLRSIINALEGEQLLDDLDRLAEIGATESGLNRIAYHPLDREGRAWVEARMHSLGMTIQCDAAGNTIGTYPGVDNQLAPIALGSHTDTVPNGGKYDGALGVLAALACVRTLRDTGTKLRHPVEVINFAAEEATMSGATLGSRAMAGILSASAVNQAAWDNQLVSAHLRSAALEPSDILKASRPTGSLAAYLELYIEQGSILEKARERIGVVTGIVGIRRYAAVFHGYANHAGTTPMNDRQDALVRAAPYITAVRDTAVAHGIVATSGTLRLHPGSPNVIPGQIRHQHRNSRS